MLAAMSKVFGPAGGVFAVLEPFAMTVVAPLLLFPGHWSVLPLVFLPSLWLVRLVINRHHLRRTTGDWPLLVFLIMLSVSLYPSVDLTLSVPKLYGLLLGLYVFDLVVHLMRHSLWQRLVPLALILGGMGVALLGLVGTNWNSTKLGVFAPVYAKLPLLWSNIPTSFGSLSGGMNPNELGGTLVLLLPLVLGLVLFSRSWALRVALSIPAAITGTTLALTQSRSAYLGLAVALLVLAGLRWGKRAALLPLAGAASLAGLWYARPEVMDRWLVAADKASDSFQWRADVWYLASLMIQDFPFTGIGLNTFPLVADRLYPLFIPHTIERIPHAHNLLLQTAVDFGLPGLTALLVMLAAAGVEVARAWPSATGWRRGVLAGAGTGLVAHLVYGLTDAVALGAKPSFLLWTVLAVAISSEQAVRRSEGDGRSEVPLRREEVSSAAAGDAGRGDSLALWLHWGFFTLACGLGVMIEVLSLEMLP